MISIIPDYHYSDSMVQVVEPYLLSHREEMYLERVKGEKIYCVKINTDLSSPKGVVMISHGFTETIEKYHEILYYFSKEGFIVYMMEHCGHGNTYSLVEDTSLVHVDCWERYVEDFLYVTNIARKREGGLPFFLYGHSMGGGIAAAVAAMEPSIFVKVVLSSPMIRPSTGKMPWRMAEQVCAACCRMGKKTDYLAGKGPYMGPGVFETSSANCRERYEFYQNKRDNDVTLQRESPSYGWFQQAVALNRYLMRTAWKKIEVPVLLFQSEEDAMVSKAEQNRFIRHLAIRGLGKMVKVPRSKHEIFGSSQDIIRVYWRRIFSFFEAEGHFR